MKKTEWDKLREKVLKRDDRKCRGNTMINQRCNKQTNIVHHIVPRNKGGKDTMENCVTVCSKHHCVADNTYTKSGLTSMANIWLEENRK